MAVAGGGFAAACRGVPVAGLAGGVLGHECAVSPLAARSRCPR
jgi:hypothetical protein